MLKLECQYASTEIAAELTRSFAESKDVVSPSEAAADPGQGLTESGDTGSSNHKLQDRPSKADYFKNMAKRAAERGSDKRPKSVRPSPWQLPQHPYQQKHLSW